MQLLFKILSGADRLIGGLQNFMAVGLSLIVACLMVFEVLTRYLLGEPLFGLEEIVLISVMWLYMVGASLACRERSHLKADMVGLFIKNQRILQGIQVLTTAISLVMALYITQWAFSLTAFSFSRGQITPVFEIPWYISQAGILFGGVMFSVYLLRDLIVDVRVLITGKPSNEQAANNAPQ